MNNEITVADIFRRAQAVKIANPQASYREIRELLVGEFNGKPFPTANTLTIAGQDALAPEEDWTAGLPIILRGIQTEDWREIAHGITLCLEQVENFQRDSGSENAPEKEWHNREQGIGEFTAKTDSKWLPEDLMNLAKRNVGR